LYEDKKIQKIIVSGGVGVEWFDEAVVMGTYLLSKWIPKDDIVVDSGGYTTRKTSENVFNILKKDITVVGISQWFHIARVKLSLKQVGFETVYWYAPRYFELRDIYSVVRELPAYVKYILNY
jgi:vancomycin permeability regulator SanA